MKVAIVDDWPKDLQRLERQIRRWAEHWQISLVPPPACYSSGEAFLADFAPERFDIVFLDIYMEGLTGMEAARKLREQDTHCRLIFTTSSADFAVDSYEVDAAYYLVKPFSEEKLWAALNRCNTELLEQQQYLTVPDKRGGQRLYLHQIAYTEYERRRVCVHNRDGSLCYIPMNQREFSALLLDYPYFCDCMRGILVNLEAVEQLGEDHFLLRGGQRVPISRLKYREVRERFLNFLYAKARGEQ